MKKIIIKNQQLSRGKLANPYTEDYHERLVKSGAIDLTNNFKIIDMGNDYIKIVPIDKNKKVK